MAILLVILYFIIGFSIAIWLILKGVKYFSPELNAFLEKYKERHKKK
ncbi:hypothetical protein H5P36_16425 [Bacillus sp. APMAM]|nr:hypothetical protein [Bacillus sp. APMAM]